MNGYSSMYDGLEVAKKESAQPTKPSATAEAAPKKSILKRADAAPPAAAGEDDSGPAAKRARTGEQGDEGDQAGGDPQAGGMGLSAAQVANMLCEMYSSKGKMRIDHMSNVFASDVKTLSLFSCEGIPEATGGEKILASLDSLGPPPAPSEACARIFVETDRAGGGSISIDVYAPGRSPGFCGTGVMSSHASAGDGGEGTIVMYRVRRDKVDTIWVGEDVGCGMQRAGSKAVLIKSPLWEHCLTIIRAHTTGVLTCHYINYDAEAKDSLGLGLGSVSEAETWQEDGASGVAEPKLGADGTKADPGEVSKARLAYEKVAGHLESDKKFKKAVALLASMLSNTLSPKTAESAFGAIKAAMGPDCSRASTPEFRRDIFDLVNSILPHSQVLCPKPGSSQDAMLKSWKLAAVTSNSLLNDDSFEFAKAAKEVMQQLQSFGNEATSSDEEVMSHQGAALVSCLSLLQSKYSFAWAKASVDMCYKLLVDPKKRDAFGKHKTRLEGLMDGMNRRKLASGKMEANTNYQNKGFQHGKMGW